MKKLVYFLIKSFDRLTDTETRIFQGLYEEAQRRKYMIRILDLHRCALPEMLEKIKEDDAGIIVAGINIQGVAELIERIDRYGLHGVYIVSPTKETEKANRIYYDMTYATERLAQHLLQKKDKLCFVGYNPESLTDAVKLSAVSQAAIHAGREMKKEAVYINEGSIKECIQRFIKDADRQEAVFCANDVIAIALIKECASKGIRVPEDLLVAGFGDSYLGRYIKPSLTTISPGYEELGKAALELISIVEGSKIPYRMDLRCECDVFFRESTGDAHRNEALEVSSGQPVLKSDNKLLAEGYDFFYEDPLVREIVKFSNVLYKSDSIDIDMLKLVLKGYHYAKISEMLNISENTVKYRAIRIFEKTGCKNAKEFKGLIENIFGTDMFGV